MFNLFGSGKNYSVGIDFGTSAIKIVELSFRNQKTYLENYGWVDLGLINPSSVIRPIALETKNYYDKKLQKYLEKLIKSMRLKSKDAYISLPGFSGLVTLINFPAMSDMELEEAIKFEAKKYIPNSLEEVAIDWEIIGEKEIAEKEKKSSQKEDPEKKEPNLKEREVLLVAAPKKEVIRCGSIVKDSGLNVKNIELEIFSLVRSVIGNDSGCFLIVDIGSRMTNIILVEKGMIRVNRNIEGGGSEITKTIAESLNISKQRAEELKKENKELLNNQEMSLTIPVLDMIANESLRTINAFREKRKENSRIDSIILSGGSSKLKGIDQYFYQKIGIQTRIGNPWSKIVYNEKINPFVEKMETSFSVALGLAFRGIEELKNKN
jgi:type IV pilus assembly protein PilM